MNSTLSSKLADQLLLRTPIAKVYPDWRTYDWPPPCATTSKVYATPHGEFPRVTKVTDLIGTGKNGLISWAAEEEHTAMLAAAGHVYAECQCEDTPDFLRQIEAHVGPVKQHKKQLEKAGDIGTEIHDMIRWRLRKELGKDEPPPLMSDAATLGYMAWEDWWKQACLAPVVVEQVVWDEEVGYAGTIDGLFLALDGCRYAAAGNLVLGDWKSSKGIYDTHHVQVGGAYLHALRRWLGPVVTSAFIVKLPKTLDDITIAEKQVGDLRYDYVNKAGRRVKGGTVVSTETLWDCFCAALTLHRGLCE